MSGKLHVFFANFKGLVPGQNAVQDPEHHRPCRQRRQKGAVVWFEPR